VRDGGQVGIAGQLVENEFGAAEVWLGLAYLVLPPSSGRKQLNAPGKASCCSEPLKSRTCIRGSTLVVAPGLDPRRIHSVVPAASSS
jgi:hypothetical protein